MLNYLIIAFSLLCAFIVIILFVRQKKGKGDGQFPYVNALHMLLQGKTEEALDWLKKTVSKDTDNIMAYILLGNVYREKGFPLRAAKIHRNLLIRGNLTNLQMENILYNLVLDYHEDNKLDKAIEMAERLVQRTKKSVKNQELLIGLYEEKGNWDKAFLCRQSMNRGLKKDSKDILALYRVQSGLDFVKQKAEKEGRIRFKEAIKLDDKCISAYLYWGDSYRRENRNEDAFNIWKTFTQNDPNNAHLAFGRLKEVLFDLGRYGEIEEIYRQLISKNPKEVTAYLNLAELYQKEGRHDEAIETCRHIIENHPDSISGRHMLAHLLTEKGEETEAFEVIMAFWEREASKKALISCSCCGYKTKELLWQCPECKAWKSFVSETPS